MTGPVGFPFKSQIERRATGLNGSIIFRSANTLLLTAGYQFREQIGNNIDLLTQTATFSNKILSSHAGFADAQLNLWDRVFGTAGIRQDEYNVFGSATTYRVTGGYLHQRDRYQAARQLWDRIPRPNDQSIIFPRFWHSQFATGEEPRVGCGHRSNFAQ